MVSCSGVRLFVFVTTAVWTAQADNYCCWPEQLEIFAGQLNGLLLSTGQGIAQLNSVYIAMDFTNERLGEEIVSYTSGKSTKIQIIIDYKKNVMYTIIGQNCSKTEARGSFIRCIPKTAHFDGNSTLGENELTIDSYSYYADIPKVSRGNTTIAVTHAGCIPVRASLVGEAIQTEPPIPMVSGTGFSNFKRGISDPGRWFNVPSICKKPTSRMSKRSVDSDGHTNAITQLVAIFNSMMLPAFQTE